MLFYFLAGKSLTRGDVGHLPGRPGTVRVPGKAGIVPAKMPSGGAQGRHPIIRSAPPIFRNRGNPNPSEMVMGMDGPLNWETKKGKGVNVTTWWPVEECGRVNRLCFTLYRTPL